MMHRLPLSLLRLWHALQKLLRMSFFTLKHQDLTPNCFGTLPQADHYIYPTNLAILPPRTLAILSNVLRIIEKPTFNALVYLLVALPHLNRHNSPNQDQTVYPLDPQKLLALLLLTPTYSPHTTNPHHHLSLHRIPPFQELTVSLPHHLLVPPKSLHPRAKSILCTLYKLIQFLSYVLTVKSPTQDTT